MNEGQVHNTQGDETVGHEAGTIPRVCAVLEDRQEGHNSTMVEVAGKIVEQSISVLIDLGSTHNYITHRVVEICAFKKLKHNK